MSRSWTHRARSVIGVAAAVVLGVVALAIAVVAAASATAYDPDYPGWRRAVQPFPAGAAVLALSLAARRASRRETMALPTVAGVVCAAAFAAVAFL